MIRKLLPGMLRQISFSYFRNACFLVFLLQFLFIHRVNAQWSAMGGGANDIVYSTSPDVTNTGIYFGINYSGGNNYLQHWNGATVANLNASCYVNGYIYAIAVSGNNVYVGGDFTKANNVAGFNGIACWNTVTNTWSSLGTGVAGSNKTVYALTVDPATSTLYVGGEFTTVNGTTANNVASWSIGSSAWSVMNPGTAGVSGVPGGSPPGSVAGVYALTYCAGKIYVGGRYTSVNGATAANSIAAWNGSAWSTLSGGGQVGVSNTTVVNPANVASAVWDAPVMALTNDGTTVYVGGDFNKVNNVTGCNNIAGWNTGSSTWSTLGAGMTWPSLGNTSTDNTFGDQANIYALTMYNGNLIAGGDFMKAGTVGGINTNLFVAQWNGSAWSGLSTGCGQSTDSDVFSLTVSNGTLYAGGQFPDPTIYIAQYTGAGPTITLSVPPNDTICSGGSVVISASGSASSYSWLPAAGLSCTGCANPTASPTVTTTYTVTATVGGCSSTKTITVVVEPKPTLTLTPVSSSLCSGSATTTITAAGASTYTWSNATTLSASTGTVVIATPTATIIYTVNATSTHGCTNSKTVTITVNTPATLTVTAASPTVCIGNSTSITAAGANTYTWSPSGSLSSPNGSPVTATPAIVTNYTVNATDGNGCATSQTISVNVNSLPTLTLTASSSTVCSGSTSTLTASGANTYTWSPAGSLSGSTGPAVTATVTATTNYTVNGTDANGCNNNQVISISVNPLPNLTVTPTSVTVCTGTSTTLTVAGADTYTWSPTGSLNSSTGTPVVASPTVNTTYTVTGTIAATGCENSTTASINIVITPTLNILPSSSFTICLNDSTTMQVTGGGTYTWTPAGTLSSSNSATVVASPTTTTIYTVSSTVGGCASAAVTATVNVNLPPDINVHAIPNSVCIGATSTLTAAGTCISFTWSPAGSLNSATGSPVIASPVVTTTYVVIGTGANGCTAKDSVRVTVNPTPTVSISSGGGGNAQTVCAGTPVNGITFSSSTGSAVNWTNTNINIGIAATGTNPIATYTAPIVTTQQTGTITAIAIDSTTGCKSDTINPPAFVVIINPLPVISATDSLTPAGCGGLANGCISNVAGQAPGTYQYSWDNGTTWSGNSQNCSIPSGNYVVEVQDANGCVSQKTISLPTANAPANPSLTGNPANTCAGDTINLSITSPSPFMTYTWTDATGTHTGTTYTINAINPAGVYTVGLMVADSNHCSNDTSLSFIVNAPPQPIISGTNHFCKGTSTVLNVSPTGSGFIYQWNNAGVIIAGATSSSYTATSGGTFGVVVTNTLTGCKHDTIITITVDSVPPAPTISTGTNSNTYCQGQTINLITVTGTGTFTWYADAGLTTPIGTGSPFTPSVTVTSTVYVTASNSVCTSDSTPVVITINPIPATPTITVGAGNNVYCQNVIPATIIATGPSTIVWYDNAVLTHVVDTGSTYTPMGLPLGTTTYYLVDSSAVGCKSAGTATVSVTINPTPNAPTLSVTNIPYCQGALIAPLSATTMPVGDTVIWYSGGIFQSNQNPFTPNISAPGTYTYVAYDSSATGCISLVSAQTVTITINATPGTPTLTTSPTVSSCQGSSVPTINAIGTGTNTVVWYNNATLTPPAITTGNNYTPPANLPIGTTTYYLTDTSTAGCKSSGTAMVSITINQNPTVTGNAVIDSSKCGANNGSVTGLTANNGTPTYIYQWINASGAVVGNSPNLTNVGPGTYSLIVIDANFCRDTSNGSGFVVGGSNAVTAGFIPSITEGQAPLAVTFSNTSIGAATYQWNFGNNTTTSTQQNPAYTYTASGTYTVILVATNTTSCSDTAKKIIIVDVTEVLIIPNIFSPNGDGINDQFFITSTGISTLTCDIFNRWGELVFTIRTINQAWDGVMNNGNHATDGTYFYILQASGYDGKEYKRNGPLTLVR